MKALISAEKEVTMDNKLSTPPIKSWAVLGDEQMNNDNFPYTMTSKGFQPGEFFFSNQPETHQTKMAKIMFND